MGCGGKDEERASGHCCGQPSGSDTCIIWRAVSCRVLQGGAVSCRVLAQYQPSCLQRVVESPTARAPDLPEHSGDSGRSSHVKQGPELHWPTTPPAAPWPMSSMGQQILVKTRCREICSERVWGFTPDSARAGLPSGRSGTSAGVVFSLNQASASSAIGHSRLCPHKGSGRR